MRPTLDIADFGIRSANCALHCTMDNPTGDIVHRGDMDRERANACDLAKPELGALDDTVAELPGYCPTHNADIAVSSTVAPTAC